MNASRLPSRTTRASLGAGAVRYSFTVTDFHRLPFAGLPAHPSTASNPDLPHPWLWGHPTHFSKPLTHHLPSSDREPGGSAAADARRLALHVAQSTNIFCQGPAFGFRLAEASTRARFSAAWPRPQASRAAAPDPAEAA
ncbi:MAG TPA: hypothetical protein VK638_32115, partial [Edaphobacter sp.]|nr:hypothetical protein [Edaphobacter sp.]